VTRDLSFVGTSAPTFPHEETIAGRSSSSTGFSLCGFDFPCDLQSPNKKRTDCGAWALAFGEEVKITQAEACATQTGLPSIFNIDLE